MEKITKGKIVPFTGVFHPDSSPADPDVQEGEHAVVNFRQKNEVDFRDNPEVFIPDASAMYSPESITINGVSVDKLLEQIRSLSDPEISARLERNLELTLLTARTRLIRSLNGPRDSMYTGLIMHTLGVADEFGELDINDAADMRSEFRGMASQMASSIFGTRGFSIIAKYDSIAQIHRNEAQAPQNTSVVQKKPNPFSIVRPE